MQRLIADRPRLALAVAATLAGLALFALGFAIAPGASGEAPPDTTADVPAASVRAVDAAKPLRVGTVRALGTLPALKAPKPKPQPPSGGGGGALGGVPPVAPPAGPPPVAPPPVAPPPVAPPPVAPPPGPPCIGAGCDYK